MCKFHILGCCSRGDACHFAHTKEELMSQPDLARTKLCKTLISTGQCNDPECRYAHSKEELRLVLGFNCNTGLPNAGPGQSFAEAAAMAAAAASASAPAQDHQQPGASLQQAAMQQLAEAAQAHAAEAMRLQSMVACLQVQGASGLTAPQFPGAHFAATAQGGCGFPGQPMPFSPAGALPSTGSASSAAAAGKGGRGQRGGRGERGGKGKGRGGGFQGGKDRMDSNAGHFSRVGGGPAYRPQASGVSDLDPMGSAGHFSMMGGGFVPQGWEEGGAPGSSYLQVSGNTEPEGMASGSMPSMQGQDTFTPSEPAQIHPLSLRSLSSCSLVDLAKAAEEQQGTTSPQTFPASGQGHAFDTSVLDGTAPLGWTVKNTFLDFKEASAPPPGRLRPICSAAGRLNALAEGPWSHSTSPDIGPRDSPFVDSSRGLGRTFLPPPHEEGMGRDGGFGQPVQAQQPSLLAEKRAQDTPLAVGQAPPRAMAATTAPQWPAGQLAGHAAACGTTGALRMGAASGGAAAQGESEDARPPAITEAGEHQGETSASSCSPTAAVAGDVGHFGAGLPVLQSPAVPAAGRAAPLLAEGITVKNTFLDFATTEPAVALRAVQTAAGRLVDLGHEDDDED